MKTVLITGASRGLGLDAAAALVKAGYRVLGTVRREADFEAVKKAGAEPVLLDVTDAAMCQKAAEHVASRFGGVDALVANAGVGISGCFEDLDDDQIRAVFEVNFFGVLNTARAFFPQLRAKKGHLIVVSSIAGRRAAPGVSIYNASKFAIEGWAEAMRFELAPFGVRVALIEPGPTTSGFTDSRMKGRRSGTGPYAAIYRRMEELYLEVMSKQDPASVVSDAIVAALAAENPAMRYPVGKATVPQLIAKTVLPWSAYEALIHAKLRLPKA